MLGDIKTSEGKESIILTDALYRGYFDREGYYKVEVCDFDTSTKDKGYIVMYFVDTEQNRVMKSNLRLKSPTNPEAEVPLEMLLRLALAGEIEQDRRCYYVDFDLLLGLECQILVEKEANYYNIHDVYPIDEVLEEYVSGQEKMNRRFPNGIFNKD